MQTLNDAIVYLFNWAKESDGRQGVVWQKPQLDAHIELWKIDREDLVQNGEKARIHEKGKEPRHEIVDADVTIEYLQKLSKTLRGSAVTQRDIDTIVIELLEKMNGHLEVAIKSSDWKDYDQYGATLCAAKNFLELGEGGGDSIYFDKSAVDKKNDEMEEMAD